MPLARDDQLRSRVLPCQPIQFVKSRDSFSGFGSARQNQFRVRARLQFQIRAAKLIRNAAILTLRELSRFERFDFGLVVRRV